MDFGDSDLPELYRAADKRAKDAQKAVLKALKGSLVGVVIAAGFGAVSLHSGSVEWAGVISSMAFGASAACIAWLLWGRPEKEWYDSRAVAESAKTLSWQYAVAGGEFGQKADGEGGVRSRFLSRLEDILEGVERLGLSSGEGSQLPPRMEELRHAEFAERRSSYIARRLSEQHGWYAGKAVWNEKRRRVWTVVTIVLLAAGLVAGLARAFSSFEVDLLGPLAAAASSAMAWARSKDYAELAAAYSVTAHELGIVEAEAAGIDEEMWGPFVERAERAISREHTLWKARRGAPRMGP